jgi:hypothetical protein
MPDNLFNRFIRLCLKCKEVEIFLTEEFLYGVVVHHTLNYPSSGRRTPLTALFNFLLRLIKFTSDVNTMGGAPPFPGLSFVIGVLVEFPSLPVSAFVIGKSLSGAK